MRHLGLLLLLAALPLGCAERDPLPGPPINTYVEVPAGEPGSYSTSRSRGVLEIYLTPADPEHTVWNGRKLDDDPWGTITLVGIDEDGTVTIWLNPGDPELSARPGKPFPGTGLHVITSNADLGTALLRSRWTQTLAIIPRPDPVEAKQVDRLRVFSSVQAMPDGRVFLQTNRERSELLMSVEREEYVPEGTAEPGDTIHLVIMHVVGAGAHWFVYLGQADDGRLLFQEYTWFYDSVFDRKELIVVSPYGDPPTDP